MYPPLMLENADGFVPAFCAEVRGSSESNLVSRKQSKAGRKSPRKPPITAAVREKVWCTGSTAKVNDHQSAESAWRRDMGYWSAKFRFQSMEGAPSLGFRALLSPLRSRYLETYFRRLQRNIFDCAVRDLQKTEKQKCSRFARIVHGSFLTTDMRA